MNQKLIIGTGIFLVLLLLAQSIFLYRMSDQVQRLSNNNNSFSQSGNTDIPKPSLVLRDPLFPFNDNWNPFEEMQRMQNEMNKIFGDMRSQMHFSPGFSIMNKSFSFSPNVGIKEENERVIVTADIPDSDESNINVTVKDDQLTISATTRRSRDKQSDDSLFLSDRFIGQFERSITLPAPVLAEKMKTDYKDGVLTIVIPKA